ncbi:MAG: sulfate adenylyltransferase subunit CysN [Bryobacteraceae bacterium]
MASTLAAPSDIQVFLKRNEEKEMLRFTTAGSVDDGKSTLIGRLLYDSKGAYEDQIASVRKATVNQTAGAMDFALLTDGLRAEREQGITIDVAYRYFSTPRRKFIIADTPGHVQYTRNMATGASTANLAIVLVDARNGVLPQSKRHAFIASLLGIPHVVVAVNKMDLVDYSRDVFERIREDFSRFAAGLRIPDLHFLPISALKGDNVVDKGRHLDWFEGVPLLEYLETVPIARDRNLDLVRFPVQYVQRPNLDFRGYAGQVVSGILRKGDPIMVLPSGRTSRIASIVSYDGDLQRAFAPMSVTVCLEDELDISRGDMLVPPSQPPQVARRMDAMVVWMSEQPLELHKSYLAKHTTQQVQATVTAIRYKVEVETLGKMPASQLELNEIGCVRLETHRPLYFDAYRENRPTGAFILIDALTNATVAAGMIEERADDSARRGPRLRLETGRVTPAERHSRLSHRPASVWLQGERSDGLAWRVERKLFDRGCLTTVVNEVSSDVLAALFSVGAIAILTGAPQEDAAEAVVVDVASLPLGEEAAAEAVCALLESRGLIPPDPNRFTGGEGI